LQQGYPTAAVPVIDIEAAREKLRLGDIDGAVKTSREAFDYLMDNGGMLWHGSAITVLVEALLARGGESDLREAQDAIDRLDGVPTDPGLVFHALAVLRLRALLATARGDDVSYRDYRDRYRAMARSLGFEGHMDWAREMP
jgi:adenylate cyclase